MRQTFLQKNSMMHLLIEWIKGDWLFSSTRKLKIVPNKWSTVILWFCGFQLGQTFRSTQENELCKDFFLVCSMSTYNPIIHIRPILTRLGDFFLHLHCTGGTFCSALTVAEQNTAYHNIHKLIVHTYSL